MMHYRNLIGIGVRQNTGLVMLLQTTAFQGIGRLVQRGPI